jgi:hypothetical protein
VHELGLDSGNGTWYLFYSGIFGVLVFAAGMTANVYVNLRKHNCHQPRCLRLGRFPVEGTPWSACHRHHPSPPQRDSIRKRYHLYAGERPGRG